MITGAFTIAVGPVVYDGAPIGNVNRRSGTKKLPTVGVVLLYVVPMTANRPGNDVWAYWRPSHKSQPEGGVTENEAPPAHGIIPPAGTAIAVKAVPLIELTCMDDTLAAIVARPLLNTGGTVALKRTAPVPSNLVSFPFAPNDAAPLNLD